MSKGYSSRQVVAVPRARPGEGPLVEVLVYKTAKVNGQTVETMGVDLGNAPVPDRKYLAETCDVTFQHGTVKLLFGQQRIGKEELRSLLVIHMSAAGAARFLSSLDQLHPSIETVSSQLGMVAEGGIPIQEEPPQTVALAAGLVLTAVANEEACLDFFQISPFSMGTARHTKKLALDPVVRVDLPTPLMLFLMQGLRKIEPRLPKLQRSEEEQPGVAEDDGGNNT